jgi:hypothetical protein
MAIASGGSIRQRIVRDTLDPEQWDFQNMGIFNLQLLDATTMPALGLPLPSTPITAATYAQKGYPFFKIYEQPSDISGTFPVKSVGSIDKSFGLHKKVHDEEQNLRFPTVGILSEIFGHKYEKDQLMLNNLDKMPPFVPVDNTNRIKRRLAFRNS